MTGMETTIVSAFVGLLCSLVSSIATFFLTKRKYNQEVDSQQIKNMSDSFALHKKMMDEIFNTQNTKLEMLQKENNELRRQVNQLQMQMINILGNLCLDTTCKLRKVSVTSDLKLNDQGLVLDDKQ